MIKQKKSPLFLAINCMALMAMLFIMPAAVRCQSSLEEFNGPFPSWANVKTRFGAKGDGKTDDTKAFQTALDSLSVSLQDFNMGKNGYSAIFIPKGIYKLSATLVLRGKMGAQIIGEDPKTTILLWQGNNKDTVFWANGSSYFKISRLQWDAGGRKNMEAFGLHWKDQGSNRYAPEEIEFSDMVFNAGFDKGISGGTFGGNDGVGMNESEITIKRCVFNECAEAGILIRGFNALDYWIWDCRFIKCKTGVISNSGNYHIYKSYFRQSSSSDVFNISSYYTSVRYCYSENSAAFSLEDGGSSNPFKRIFEGNTVTGLSNIGILYTHAGKITMLDNVFTGAPVINTKTFLQYGSWANSSFDLLDQNNAIQGFPNNYNITQPSKVFKSKKPQLRKTVENGGETFLKSMPATPSTIQRTVFEVTPSYDAAKIQEIINKASAFGKKAIVHFAFGTYIIDKPLVVPVNSDIQIMGDGHLGASRILKVQSSVFSNTAMLKIICPTTISIRELEFGISNNNYDNSRAIVLENADQPQSVAFLDQFYADNDTSLLVKDYNYTLVQKTNSFFTTGNYVSGGEMVENGVGSSKVLAFGAQYANCTLLHNGTFIARDCWWEGSSSMPVNMKGNGNFIIDGGMVAPRKMDSSAVINIDDFKGNISLMDMYVVGSLLVKTNNPSLNLLAWNINFYHKKQPLAFLSGRENYKAFFGGLSTQCFNNNDPDCSSLIITKDKTINISDTDDFIDKMTNLLRSSRPVDYVVKPIGVTNFYLSRVAVSEKFKTGIAFIK